MLLALGRVWEGFPPAKAGSPEESSAIESQRKVVQTLTRFSDSKNLQARKASVLAMCFMSGLPIAKTLEPVLIRKLLDTSEDLDVRMAAATALGPIASPDDKDVIDALHKAMNDTQPEHAELVWDSALSLAQLNQPDVADTILMLLDRKQLDELKVYDRETDPQNPVFRTLNEQEKLRILINTMMGAKHLKVDAVQAKLKDLAEHDPSPRVRAAGVEVLNAQ